MINYFIRISVKSGIQQHHILSWFIHWSVFLKNGGASERSKDVYKVPGHITAFHTSIDKEQITNSLHFKGEGRLFHSYMYQHLPANNCKGNVCTKGIQSIRCHICSDTKSLFLWLLPKNRFMLLLCHFGHHSNLNPLGTFDI